VPVEALIAILVLSVVANAALLFWLARSDHVTIHWPLWGADATTPRWPNPDPREPPTGRRRSLFVAGQSDSPTAFRPGPSGTTTLPGTSSLPPELAELLSTPASLGPATERPGQPYPGGFRAMPADGTLVRMHPAAAPPMGAGIVPDALTGLEDLRSWSRIVEVENARLLRYRRPSTIVVAELDGLRRLAERLGDEPVARLLPVVADAFRAEARDSDWVARIGYGRFAAFLAETDEIAAINYVERIRQICEPWLSSSAVPLRLAIGWSSPSGASDMEFAIKRAEERMHLDRRLPAKLPAPRAATPRVVALPEGQAAAGDDESEGVSPAEPGSLETADEGQSMANGEPHT